MSKFNDNTPASEFPVLWYGGGNDDEMSGLVEKIVNKNICLYLSALAADEFGGVVAGFDDGRATMTFLLDGDGLYEQIVDVEEEFVRHSQNVSYEPHECHVFADTFQRLADLFRKQAEDR